MIGERRRPWVSALIAVPFILFAISTFIPYYWMVTGAFKGVPELIRNPPTFFVESPTLNNFYDPLAGQPNHVDGLFQRFVDVPGRFGRIFLNSVALTVSITAVSILLASLTAYVLAKHRFPGRNFIFLLILGSMMVPWQVNIIPNFVNMRTLGWLDPDRTFLALFVPALPKAFAVFFLRQYMLSIPDDLMDAARVDGAGEWRIWWQMIMPLTLPAVTAVAILGLLGEWNNFVWPLLIIQEQSQLTLPVALARLNSQFTSPSVRGVLMAAALLISLPAVAMFLAFQRQFVESVARVGVKG